MDLYKVTSYLKVFSLNHVAQGLQVEPKEILDFLKHNGLLYVDGEVLTILDLEPPTLKPPDVKYVRRRSVGADVATLKKWDRFTNMHDEYKIYELITLALTEFMDKYK